MLRVGERVLLLALSKDPDKHPLGYLSSRLLADVSGMHVKGVDDARAKSLSYYGFVLNANDYF